MDKEMGFTERQQALIDGVEFGIDHQLELDPGDVEEYHKLTGSRCVHTENMEQYRQYLLKYAKKHGISIWEANQHKLCHEVAVITYGLDEKDLNWFDENL